MVQYLLTAGFLSFSAYLRSKFGLLHVTSHEMKRDRQTWAARGTNDIENEAMGACACIIVQTEQYSSALTSAFCVNTLCRYYNRAALLSTLVVKPILFQESFTRKN
jgi:hypothetical protein